MNKRMELERYSTKILKVLSFQRKSPAFDKLVREIMAERFIYADYPYTYTYGMYRRSDGVEKLAYGDALATHLMSGEYFIEEKDLDSLLPNLSVDVLCNLSNSSSEFIREKSSNYLVDKMGVELEEVVITRPKVKVNKMNKKQIIDLRRKGD